MSLNESIVEDATSACGTLIPALSQREREEFRIVVDLSSPA